MLLRYLRCRKEVECVALYSVCFPISSFILGKLHSFIIATLLILIPHSECAVPAITAAVLWSRREIKDESWRYHSVAAITTVLFYLLQFSFSDYCSPRSQGRPANCTCIRVAFPVAEKLGRQRCTYGVRGHVSVFGRTGEGEPQSCKCLGESEREKVRLPEMYGFC